MLEHVDAAPTGWDSERKTTQLALTLAQLLIFSTKAWCTHIRCIVFTVREYSNSTALFSTLPPHVFHCFSVDFHRARTLHCYYCSISLAARHANITSNIKCIGRRKYRLMISHIFWHKTSLAPVKFLEKRVNSFSQKISVFLYTWFQDFPQFWAEILGLSCLPKQGSFSAVCKLILSSIHQYVTLCFRITF